MDLEKEVNKVRKQRDELKARMEEDQKKFKELGETLKELQGRARALIEDTLIAGKDPRYKEL